MKALIRQEGDVFVIHLKGKVDFDSTEPFRNTVLSHLTNQKVVFNLHELDFVGSNGITPFVETLVELSHIGESAIHFCNMSTEFQRIFEASGIRGLKIFEDEVAARNSFFALFQNSQEMPEITYSSGEVEPLDSVDAGGSVSTPD